VSAERVENAELRRKLERSQGDLETARRVIEVQGNVSALCVTTNVEGGSGVEGRFD
jgi:hypothetical protein